MFVPVSVLGCCGITGLPSAGEVFFLLGGGGGLPPRLCIDTKNLVANVAIVTSA